MLVALDTNILVYTEGLNGQAMQARGRAIIDRLAPESTLLPVQVLGELFNVLTRKAGQSRRKAREAVLSWGDTYPLIETSSSVQLVAMDLAGAHDLGPWDAVVLSAAADAGCRLLLSEDLQDGAVYGGVTVPTRLPKRHPLLRCPRAE
jgi:predicted nucleic acid-binding protein